MVNLGELALACFAYGAIASYDDSLAKLEKLLGNEPDLADAEHGIGMIKWLNQWQCRQFSLACRDDAAAELLAWYKEAETTLPDHERDLWILTPGELEQCVPVFDSLSKKQASVRKQAGRESVVTFGPTAAAKILFALRPRIFVAWDEPIRRKLGHDGSGRSYVDFLLRLREELLDLESQCRRHGLQLETLPGELGRPDSTPAQLLDEYYWATKTREVALPSREQVALWVEWFGE